MSSERARLWCLSLGSIVFGLVLIELPVVLKLVDYRRVIGSEPRYGSTVYDPELVFTRPPYTHFRGYVHGGDIAAEANLPASALSDYRWDLTYDRIGFRNSHDLYQADLAVIGDSFVEAPSVVQDQLMTSVLGRLQGRVVANLGRSGYGPQQELAIVKRYALPLHPRLAIWMFYEGNDLRDAVWYREHVIRTAAAEAQTPAYFSNLVAKTFTNNLLVRIKHSLTAKESGKFREGVIESHGRRTTVYFAYPMHPLTSWELDGFNMTASILREAHRLCTAQGCRLLIVFVPDKFRILRPFCQFPSESRCRDWILNDMPERMREVARSISPGVGFLDLTPYLMDAMKKGIMPYFRDDIHWTPEAHRVAAEAIDAYIRIWEQLPPS